VDDLASGTKFAGYRIEAVAGRGGMGVVYRATQLGLDRPVALKVIAAGLLGDPRVRERFLRESRAAAAIPFRPVPAGRYKVRFSGTRLFDPQDFWIGYRNVMVAKTKAVQ
jgi:serine/threonine protein kinase